MRALRYHQHKPDGTVVQAEWLTNFSIAKLGSLSFYRMAKSRWEIENQGFNDGKNRYGMEHICHHEPNSILIVWLLIHWPWSSNASTGCAICTGETTAFAPPCTC